jgi:hypothetical protein
MPPRGGGTLIVVKPDASSRTAVCLEGDTPVAID